MSMRRIFSAVSMLHSHVAAHPLCLAEYLATAAADPINLSGRSTLYTTQCSVYMQYVCSHMAYLVSQVFL